MSKNLDLLEDREYLQSMPILVFGKWMREHFTGLYNDICDRLRQILPGIVTSYDPETQHYCSVDIFYRAKQFVNDNQAHDSNFFPLLSLVAFAASESPDNSCQKILFKSDKKMEIFGRDEAFLRYWESTNESVHNEVMKMLTSNREAVDNPLYILQNRTDELAFAEGLSVVSWITPFFSGSTRASAYDRFLTAKIPPILDLSDRMRYALNRSLLWYMVRLFVTTDVSADYMLLQDYSNFALYDGNPLPDSLKIPFSAFLCATTDTQYAAVNYMFFNVV